VTLRKLLCLIEDTLQVFSLLWVQHYKKINIDKED